MAEQVEFNCPHCGQLYRLTTEQLQRYAGRTTNCRKCQQPFTFPSVDPEPEPQPDLETQPGGELVDFAPAAPPPQQASPPPPRQPYAIPNQTYVPPQEPQPPQQPSPHPMNYRRPRRRPDAVNLADLFTFKSLLTPPLIMVLFWVVSAFFIYSGVRIMIAAFDVPSFSSGFGPIPTRSFSLEAFGLGLGWALIGPIVLRIVCEIPLALYRIVSALGEDH